MAKIDKIKEFINYLKVFLVIIIATEVSLIGWLANHYKDTDEILLISAMISLIIMLFGIYFLNKKIIKDIRSLEEL